MQVQRIEPVGARKVRIFFDEGETILISQKDFLLLRLETGDVILPELYEKILETILVPQAKKKAMDFLVRQDRSEGELFDKLLEKEFPESVCMKAIEYVKSFHYLDDARFARNYIDVRRNRKSRYELTMELRRKKVPDYIIEDAFYELGLDGNSEAVRNLIRKKYPMGVEELDYRERQKLIAYLMRKGFSYDEIKKEL